MKNLFETFGIRHVTSSPYVSKARGVVERKIREYREYSRRFAELYPKVRVELSYAFCTKVLNNLKLKNIPATPAFLASYEQNSFVYKQEYTTNLMSEFRTRLVMHNAKDREKDRIDCEEAYNNAIAILKDIKQKRMTKLNKNKRKHDFELSDIVLVRNYERKVKHDNVFIFEPHVIRKIIGSLVVTQSLITGVVRNRHISHIKRVNKLKNLEIPPEIIAKNNFFNEILLEQIKKQSKLPEELTKMRLRKRENAEALESRLEQEEIDELLNLDDEVEFELA